MPAKEDLGVDISRKCMIDFQWMRGVTKVVFEFLFSVERLEIHFMKGFTFPATAIRVFRS